MIDKYLELKSLDPKYWGKSGWIFLNSIALTYEPIYKENYRLFIQQLPYILPCKTCGENLKKNLPTLNNALESKEKFINWLINIRNEIYKDINVEFKQKNLKNSFEEILNKTTIYKYIWVFFLIFILILLIYLLKYTITDNI
jgi:hypothetical protein